MSIAFSCNSSIVLMLSLLCLTPSHSDASEVTADEPVELAVLIGIDGTGNVPGIANGYEPPASETQTSVVTAAASIFTPSPSPVATATAVSFIDWLLLAVAPVLLWLLHSRWPSAGGTSRSRP